MGFVQDNSIMTTKQENLEAPSASTATWDSEGLRIVSSVSGERSHTLKNLLFLDFETYWNTKDRYTLANKKCSMLEYIKDPRFKVHGCAIAINKTPSLWFGVFPQDIMWENYTVVSHNAKFDGGILEFHYGVRPQAYIDTLSMSRAVLGYSIKDHHLRTLAEHFGLVPKGEMKTDGKRDLTPEEEAELAEYCGHDNDLARQILALLAPKFPASQYWSMDHTIKCFVRPQLMLDAEALRQCNTAEKERKAKIFEEVKLPKSVFSSNDKFAALLKERGFEVPMKWSAKQEKEIPALAAADEGFQDMLDSENDELEGLCIARMAAKSNLLETRSERLLKIASIQWGERRGLFPFDILYSGAQQTHRYSGGSGAGGNPQNFKNKSGLRSAVCPPPGYKLGVADLAKAEAKKQAFLARDPILMKIFREDGNPYTDFATRHYKRTITKDDAQEYKFGKECILGLGYGMGAVKFILRARIVTGIRLTLEEGYEVVDLYRETYTIEDYWRTLDGIIPALYRKQSMPVPNAPFLWLRNGEIVLPSGLTLKYPNLRAEGEDWVYDTYQGRTRQKHAVKLYGGKVLEGICQSLTQECAKEATKALKGYGIDVVGQNHDELLFLDHAFPANPRLTLVEKIMGNSAPWWPELPLKAESKCGPNWLLAKP